MLDSIDSMMTNPSKDDILEITDKNYQKIAETLEKSGYREGVTEGRDSIFQKSFDNGYEDGFRIGYLLAMSHKEKAGRGNCAICVDGQLLKKPEGEVRDMNRQLFEKASS